MSKGRARTTICPQVQGYSPALRPGDGLTWILGVQPAQFYLGYGNWAEVAGQDGGTFKIHVTPTQGSEADESPCKIKGPDNEKHNSLHNEIFTGTLRHGVMALRSREGSLCGGGRGRIHTSSSQYPLAAQDITYRGRASNAARLVLLPSPHVEGSLEWRSRPRP